MSAGSRIVASIRAALAAGPMGQHDRTAFYREFISCGFRPALSNTSGDIVTVKTSCAIFMRAVLHDSGVRPATRPGRMGQGIFDGWLEGLTLRSPSWVPYTGREKPTPGCIFYIEDPGDARNCHVGCFVSETTDAAEWETAEGGKNDDPTKSGDGDSDGTLCSYGFRKLQKLQGARHLLGWWNPEIIAPQFADTDPGALALANNTLDEQEETTGVETPDAIKKDAPSA